MSRKERRRFIAKSQRAYHFGVWDTLAKCWAVTAIMSESAAQEHAERMELARLGGARS